MLTDIDELRLAALERTTQAIAIRLQELEATVSSERSPDSEQALPVRSLSQRTRPPWFSESTSPRGQRASRR